MSETALPGDKPVRRELTDDQKKALRTDCNVSVTAGAGSGKTTILVERYLKLVIDEGADIRSVLAITFTDKAAAEMLERVSEVVGRRLLSPEYRHQRRLLLSLRERLNSAQISTIHAFCSRLLREFAVAASIDPDFTLLSDYQYQLLLSDSLNEFFTRLDKGEYDDVIPREDILELLRQVPPGDLRKILEACLKTPHLAGQVGNIMGQMSEETFISALEAKFMGLLREYVDTAALLVSIAGPVRAILRAGLQGKDLQAEKQSLPEKLELIQRLKSEPIERVQLWNTLLEVAQLMVTDKGKPYTTLRSFGNKKVLGDAAEPLLELSSLLHPLAQFAREVAASGPGEWDRRGFRFIQKVWQLYRLAADIYRHKKDEQGLLDFEDLQLLAVDLIRHHPEVRQALSERYQFIMVDEFQDTNDLQWELIELIGRQGDTLQEDKFFVVGDPKQSIYGFRNADVRVFQNVKKQFSNAAANGAYGGEVVLTESFRFLPELNHFINVVFEQIMGKEQANEFEVAYEHLETRRPAASSAHVELALLNVDEMNEQNVSQEDYVCRRVSALLESGVHGYRPGDIAVLIPNRSHLTTLEAAMRQYGIPFKTLGGVGFYRRQEIFDVYHLLRFLDDPADDLALVALLRSPFAGISDAALLRLSLERRADRSYFEVLLQLGSLTDFSREDRRLLSLFREQLQRWLARKDRLSLAKLVQEILDDSLYRATIAVDWNGEQLLANLDKIVEMVRSMEQAGFTSLGDFISRLHELILSDPREGEEQIALEDAGTVKIMTIHAAKGLEFPVVFCPYLGAPNSHRGSTFGFDIDGWFACQLRDPANRFEVKKPFLYHWINYRKRLREAAEKKRLLYVAATRARDQLYLVGKIKNKLPKPPNALYWLCDALQIEAGGDGDELLDLDGCQVQVVRTMPDDRRRKLQRSSVESSVDKLNRVIENPVKPERLPLELREVVDYPGGVTFSATQLMTFERSEEEYFRRYHLGFFESDYEFIKQLSDPDGRALLKGKIVHQILEDGLPESPAQMDNALQQAFFRYEIFDLAEQEQLRLEIPGLLERFRDSETAERVFSAREWRSELSLTMAIGDDFFTGALDRVFLNPEGLWEVIDYKTNNISAAQVEKTAEKYRLQMQAYALLLSTLFPGQEGYPVCLYFLAPGVAHLHLYTRDEIEEIHAHLAGLIQRIKQYYPFQGGQVPNPPLNN